MLGEVESSGAHVIMWALMTGWTSLALSTLVFFLVGLLRSV